MISIFICEDDPNYLHNVKRCIEKYVSIQNFAMPIVCASSSPYDILDYIQNNEKIAGLYFLDIDLGSDINGVELAKEIRKHDPRGFIVFITSDGESYKLTFEYRVEAMDYIVKSDINLGERIAECIENAHIKAIAKSTPLQDNYVFKLAKDTKGLLGAFKFAKDALIAREITDILYFEVSAESKHMITVYTADSFYAFRGSLSGIEKDMDKKCFYKPQRNLIVNLDKITVVDQVQECIFFNDTMRLDISPRKINKLANVWKEYKQSQN